MSVPESDREFVTDAEIAARWGVCDKTARRAIHAFTRQGGFPPRDPLFGQKRYWPAVQAFLRARAGLTVAPINDGQENWNGQATKRRRRPGAPLETSR